MRAWAPLAMAAKVDLSTSTDWKEAKCKCEQEGGARAALRGHSPAGQHPASRLVHPRKLGKLRSHLPGMDAPPPINSHAPHVPSPGNYFPRTRSRAQSEAV